MLFYSYHFKARFATTSFCANNFNLAIFCNATFREIDSIIQLVRAFYQAKGMLIQMLQLALMYLFSWASEKIWYVHEDSIKLQQSHRKYPDWMHFSLVRQLPCSWITKCARSDEHSPDYLYGVLHQEGCMPPWPFSFCPLCLLEEDSLKIRASRSKNCFSPCCCETT